jgi:NadR type nicotinamide-nucleotide adenylyltransferase
MLQLISITGPESSGKTTLAKMLAAHYDTVYVPEFARTYLTKIHRPYMESDLLEITKGQLQLETQKAAFSKDYLFCDSDITVMKIWATQKYGRCDDWIEEKNRTHHYDLYVLCEPDIAWEADPLRENPNDRYALFDLYIKELEEKKANYIIVNGTKQERLNKVIEAITPSIP